MSLNLSTIKYKYKSQTIYIKKIYKNITIIFLIHNAVIEYNVISFELKSHSSYVTFLCIIVFNINKLNFDFKVSL